MNSNIRPVRVFKRVWNPETRKTDQVFDHFGTFHGFGLSYEEFENGAASLSVAIVEKTNGEVCMPPADLIKFMHSRGNR